MAMEEFNRVWVAIIGLIGTVIASTAFSELLRQRDRRSSIKTDLELWEKMPDGRTRDELLKFIEQRVDEIASAGSSSLPTGKLIFAGFMLVALLALMPLTFYSGGYHLARNADGVLQVRTAHFAMGFMPFLLLLFATIFASMWAGVYSRRLWVRLRRRLNRPAPSSASGEPSGSRQG
jgi:hypothetical protein